MTSTHLLISAVKNLLSLLEGQIQDSKAVIDVYDAIGKVEKEMKFEEGKKEIINNMLNQLKMEVLK